MMDDVSVFIYDGVSQMRDLIAFHRGAVLADSRVYTDDEILFSVSQLNVCQSYISDMLAVLRAELMRRDSYGQLEDSQS